MGANLNPCSHFSANLSSVLDLVPMMGNDFKSNPAFNGTPSRGAAGSVNVAAGGAILIDGLDQGVNLL